MLARDAAMPGISEMVTAPQELINMYVLARNATRMLFTGMNITALCCMHAVCSIQDTTRVSTVGSGFPG